ncbi:MAG: MarR family winged helix-turn-helix transcriptional regulator [Limisphaerales bacterium]
MLNEYPSTPRYRALIQLLRTAEDLWNSSRVFFNRWDLSPSQFNVLNVLHGAPDGLSQSDLSRMLLMHRSNATGLIDRLEKRSLVRREPNPTDRRAYRVVLTPEGSQLLDRIHPHYFAAADRVWSTLPDPAVHQFLSQLEEINAHAAAVAAVEAASPGNHPADADADAKAVSLPPDSRSVPPRRPRPPRVRSRPPEEPFSEIQDDTLRTSDL